MARTHSPRHDIDRYTPTKRRAYSPRYSISPYSSSFNRPGSSQERSRDRSSSRGHCQHSRRSRSPYHGTSRRERSPRYRSHGLSSSGLRHRSPPPIPCPRRDFPPLLRPFRGPALVSKPMDFEIREAERLERSARLPGPPMTVWTQEVANGHPALIKSDKGCPLLPQSAVASMAAQIAHSGQSSGTLPVLQTQPQEQSSPTPTFKTQDPLIAQSFTMIGRYLVPTKTPQPQNLSQTPASVPDTSKLRPRKFRPPIRASMGIRGFFIGPGGAFVMHLQDTHRVMIVNRKISAEEVEIEVQAKFPVTVEAEERADFVYKGMKIWIARATEEVSKGAPHPNVSIMQFFSKWKG